MGTNQFITASAVEGLYRAMRPRLSPEGKARLATAGFDVNSTPGLPFGRDQWTALVEAAREVMYPSLSREEGSLELGRTFVRGYFETVGGRALLVLIKLLGPNRAIERSHDNLRSGNPSNECVVEKVGPTQYRVSVSQTWPDPEFTQGLMEQGVRMAGAPQCVSKLVERRGDGAVFWFRW